MFYYFGINTFSGQYDERTQIILAIPNLVTKQFYLTHLRERILVEKSLHNRATNVVQTFYAKGTIEELGTFVRDHYFSCFGNDDYTWMNELTVKAMFLTLIQNGLYSTTFSEEPTQRGVADLVLLLKPDQRFHPLLDFLFEFKYLSLKTDLKMTGKDMKALTPDESTALPQTQKAFAEAEESSPRYRAARSSSMSTACACAATRWCWGGMCCGGGGLC